MRIRLYALVTLLFTAFIPLRSQMLMPDDAVKKALSSAFELKSADMMKKIASLQNSPGATGLLPNVGLNAGYSGAIQNANLTFNNGSEVSRRGASSSSITAGLSVNQILYQGGRVAATGKMLTSLEESAAQFQVSLKAGITEGVLNAYFLIVREMQWLKQIENLDSLYREKLNYTEILYRNDKASYLDLLQAQSDAATVQASLERRRLSLNAAILQLNYLMSEPPDTKFNFGITSIPENLKMPDTSMDAVGSKNASLQKLKKDWEAALHQLKMVKSELMPTVQFNGNFNLLRNQSEVGVLLRNISNGPTAGVSLSYPVFNGGMSRKNIQIAELRASLAEFAYRQAYLRMASDVALSVSSFQSAVFIEKINREVLAKQMKILEITSNSFRLGQASKVELAQAQQLYEQALAGYMDALYQKMLAFHSLNRLTGVYN